MNDAEDLIKLVEDMSTVDFSRAPSIVFCGKLRAKLVRRNFFTAQTAEAIISSMNISLPEGCMDEEQIDRLASAFCDVLDKMRAGLFANGFDNPVPALINQARNMSVKMS